MGEGHGSREDGDGDQQGEQLEYAATFGMGEGEPRGEQRWDGSERPFHEDIGAHGKRRRSESRKQRGEGY